MSSFTTGQINTFTPVDYVLFALILGFSAGIGVFYAIKDRNKKSTKDFLLAGGNMPVMPVAMSLLASFMSAITLLGTPAEMYLYGTMFFWMGISYIIAIGGAAHLYIPVFYRLQVTSAYEYLEHRFNRYVRTAASLTFSIQMLLYMAIVLYAPSLALNAVTGFTLWGSVISVGLVCTMYTAVGGMKAVLWADTFQVFMMLAGLLAVIIQGSIELGGFGNAWAIAEENARVYFTDFRVHPAVRHSVWSLTIGAGFMWLAVYGTNQAQVQRAITCPSLFKAKLALWINLPGLWIILYLSCIIGILVYAFYSTCDPQTFGLVFASDQLLPLFVMDVLGNIPGVPGLFVACLFSGALSTISSGLNSLAAVILQDIVKGYIVPDITEERATLVSKGLAFVFGVVCLLLSYVASLMGGVLQAALSLYGMISGPLLGVFTLGMFCPWANAWGGFVGLMGSLLFTFWIGVGAQIYKFPVDPVPLPIRVDGCNWTVSPLYNSSDPFSLLNLGNMSDTPRAMSWPPEGVPEAGLYTISYLWYTPIAVMTCVLVGSIVSLATGREKNVDPKLICPLFDILFPYLPKRASEFLHFGVDHSQAHLYNDPHRSTTDAYGMVPQEPEKLPPGPETEKTKPRKRNKLLGMLHKDKARSDEKVKPEDATLLKENVTWNLNEQATNGHQISKSDV